MIVRQRLESVGLSLGVHVRLARVSCGATLRSPIPAAYKTVTSYQEEAGRRGKGKERLPAYITIRWLYALALLPRLSLVLTLVSPSFSLSIRLPLYTYRLSLSLFLFVEWSTMALIASTASDLDKTRSSKGRNNPRLQNWTG